MTARLAAASAPVTRMRGALGARLQQAGAAFGPDAFVAGVVGLGVLAALVLFVALRRPIVLCAGPVVSVAAWRCWWACGCC